MNAASSKRLELVHPELRRRIIRMELMFGETFEVIQGLRDWKEQEAIWKKGRDANDQIIDIGQVVTYARPGHSWHNFGLAVDLCPLALLYIKGWYPANPAWKKLGVIGETVGLTWGGRWAGKKNDQPHFQLTGRFGVSPDDEVRALYDKELLTGVWTATGIPIPPEEKKA